MSVVNFRSVFSFRFMFAFAVVFPVSLYADFKASELSDAMTTKVVLERVYTKNIAEDIKNIESLEKMPAYYDEVIFELIRRIRYEIQYNVRNISEVRYKLMLTAGMTLSTLTDAYDVKDTLFSHKLNGVNDRLLKEIDYTIYDFNKYHGSDLSLAPYFNLVMYQIRAAIFNMDVKFPSLVEKLSTLSAENYKNHNIYVPSVPELKNREAEQQKEIHVPSIIAQSSYKKLDIETYKKDVERIHKELSRRVIEQPEVVNYLTEMLKRDYLHTREAPEVFMTLGLPGGGKDTIAENFVKSLYRGEANWEHHIYRFAIIRSESELWSELGSATGYLGSEKFPPFLKWAVEHSGGKYRLIEGKNDRGEVVYKVEKNPLWSGQNLPGYYPPERSILFLNEFHDWSKGVKNSFAKQLLEKGIIPINNPNGGLNHMQLNFTIQIASNDGIGLLADRHIDGRPRGKRQQYDELISRWKAVHNNDSLIRADIMKSKNEESSGKDPKGTSEEVANRIRNLFLLRPLSPEALQKIANIFLENLKIKYTKLNSEIGTIKLAWTDKVVEFIQNYNYVAEENSRPIEHKVKELIQQTIDKAIFSGEIKSIANQEKYLQLDVVEKENGTFELHSKIQAKDLNTSLILPIDGTNKTKFNEPLSKKQVEELMMLPSKMKQQIFGVDHVIDKLSKAIFKSEVHRNVNLERVDAKLPPANVFGFFGLSSTGKTETTKVLAEVLTGNRENVWTVSGSQLQSQEDWREHFGYDQANPNEISQFQKEFDRKNGRLIVVLDEISDSYLKGVKILYDYFREGEVGGRKMANVTFILTGNTGQEWYQGIPADVPEAERHFSMLEIYNRAVKNVRQQEVLLMRYFPEALIKRIGMDRIFFFPPLNFKSIRQMFLLKITQAFKQFFSPNIEGHWYDVKFKNEKEALRAVELFERQGFRLDSQGASVDMYVHDKLSWPIKDLLITNHVPEGAKVDISISKNVIQEGEFADKSHNSLILKVEVPSIAKSFELPIEGKNVAKAVRELDSKKVFTAYHEAGHSLVREVFLGDKYKSTGISIIPGVTNFGAQWIYYAGIARSRSIETMSYTKDAVIREMAVLHGGWMAEVLVSKNETHNAGKRNDMERATLLAQNAILRYGLSERFGRVTIPSNMSANEFVKSMTSEKRSLYEQELDRWIKESEQLARDALLINYKALVVLAKKLAIVGDLKANDLKSFYEKASKQMILEWNDHERFAKLALLIHQNKYTRDTRGFVKYWPQLTLFEKLKFKYHHQSKALHKDNIEKRENQVYKKRDAEFRHESLVPKNVANIEALIDKYIKDSQKDVKLPANFPVNKDVEQAITGFFNQPSVKMMQCKALFQ